MWDGTPGDGDESDATGGVTTMEGTRRVSVLLLLEGVPLSSAIEEVSAGGFAAVGVADAAEVDVGPADATEPGDEAVGVAAPDPVDGLASDADVAADDAESGTVGGGGNGAAGSPMAEPLGSVFPGMESSQVGGLEDTTPSRSDDDASLPSVTRRCAGSFPAAIHAAQAKYVCAFGSGAASADAVAVGDTGGDTTASPMAPVAAHRGTVSNRAFNFGSGSLHAMQFMQFSCAVNPHTETTF